MPKKQEFILAIDQGTTSSRAILYDLLGAPLVTATRELSVSFPEDAWVEQDPTEIWESVHECLQEVLGDIDAEKVLSLGITNQRETIIAWDPETGEPSGPAIVWQCRRSAGICERMRSDAIASSIPKKTGLVIDAYFSATKIRWMIENSPEIARKVKEQSIVFGTVDSWLLYQLTRASGSAVLATEASNASRTMLYNITSADWDDELLEYFGVARANLCALKPSMGHFGDWSFDGTRIPITAVLGDQQSSLFGHGCQEEGSAKCTFGTGAFLLLNTGAAPISSDSGLISSVAWEDGVSRRYVREGSIFIAGSLITWLRDGLGIIEDAGETETRAAAVGTSNGVQIVPAFVGLGAPYWDEAARGAMFGLTRECSADHIIFAALEAVAHQVADLLESDDFSTVSSLRIDGGMAKNSVFAQLLADFSGLEIIVPENSEVTCFGAASASYSAARQLGLASPGAQPETEGSFTLGMAGVQSKSYLPKPRTIELASSRKAWKLAISRVLLK